MKGMQLLEIKRFNEVLSKLLVNLFGNAGLENAHKSEWLRNIGVISKIVLGNELEGEWARDIGGMATVRIEAYPL